LPTLILEVGDNFQVDLREGPKFAQNGKPVKVPDMTSYSRLWKTGRFVDPERTFNLIVPSQMRDLSRDKGEDIWVVRDCGLGDVLLLSPVLRKFQEKWKPHRINFLTNAPYVPLFSGRPFVHSTQDWMARHGNHPYVIDLVGYSERAEDRRLRHRQDVFASYMDVMFKPWGESEEGNAERKPEFDISERESRWAWHELEANGVEQKEVRVGLQLRGAAKVRTWPIEHCKKFTKLCGAAGYKAVIFDHEARMGWEDDHTVNFCGKLTIRQVAALMDKCDVFVAPDSGLLHVAGAMEIPTIGLFGTIPPELRIKYYRNAVAVTALENCKANGGKACFDNASCWESGEQRADCMRGITPERVLEEVQKLL
jgi:ADP-heptose:LPS heptosyltransferase